MKEVIEKIYKALNIDPDNYDLDFQIELIGYEWYKIPHKLKMEYFKACNDYGYKEDSPYRKVLHENGWFRGEERGTVALTMPDNKHDPTYDGENHGGRVRITEGRMQNYHPGVVEALNESIICPYGEATVNILRDKSKIYTPGVNSKIYAYDNSFVEASTEDFVVAKDNSLIRVSDDCPTIIAYDNVRVIIDHANAIIIGMSDNISVSANEDSIVTIYGKGQLSLGYGATGYVYDEVKVWGSDGASIHLYENALLMNNKGYIRENSKHVHPEGIIRVGKYHPYYKVVHQHTAIIGYGNAHIDVDHDEAVIVAMSEKVTASTNEDSEIKMFGKGEFY